MVSYVLVLWIVVDLGFSDNQSTSKTYFIIVLDTYNRSLVDQVFLKVYLYSVVDSEGLVGLNHALDLRQHAFAGQVLAAHERK